MCGISAIVSGNPTRNHNWVFAANEAQHMRGPDHAGMSEAPNDPCVLGHTRLSLLDLSHAGDQPMSAGPERLSITYNGEVYNHRELRARCPAWHFEGGSDTESILAHIAIHGIEDTLERMNGMFALALWDSKEQALYMATDRFGVKPLFISRGVGTVKDPLLACASSSAALLHLKPTWRLDRQGIAQFFHLGGSAAGVWQGIERIGGGMLLKYDFRNDRLTRTRWYTPAFNANAADELPGLITDAIHIASKADVPVGIFFSGGIDTSVIASLMPSHDAFHLDGPELGYARTGAAHFGLRLHVVERDSNAVLDALTDIATRSGEPTMAGHIPWVVSRDAATKVKACLSGNGADELFFGYDRTPRSIDAATRMAQHQHIFRDATKYGGEVCAWPVPDLGSEWPDDAWPRWKELYTYVQHDLNPTLDAASMCHSLEMRVPFLDHRVVEAALSLDHNHHGTKRVLKDMLRAAGLSKEYIERPKLGFSMNTSNVANDAYARKAWAFSCELLGMNAKARLTPRDSAYLHLCAAGFKAWYDVHEHRIAA